MCGTGCTETRIDISSAVNEATETAEAIAREIAALPVRNTPAVRAVRRAWSQRLANREPALVRAVADALLDIYSLRWCGYEPIAEHPAAFAGLNLVDIAALGPRSHPGHVPAAGG